ncbi:MAG: ATPase [Treponema sp.]|nr:ATPase [Treponema sp.]
MAKTAEMRLLELMVLKQDVASVIEYIGKKGSFQFHGKKTSGDKADKSNKADSKSNNSGIDIDGEIYIGLNNASIGLNIPLEDKDISEASSPTDDQRTEASKIISLYKNLSKRIEEAIAESTKITDAYKEALAFANLQVSYSELEHLSFVTLRVGKLDPANFDDLKAAVSGDGIIVSLGEDKSYILVACSKKNRTIVDPELKKFGFIEIEISKDFKGVPADVLEGLEKKKQDAENTIAELEVEKNNFAETHKEAIHQLLKSFAIGVQISEITKNLESTELVYRMTGWVPKVECESYMKELDDLTKGRIAIREYEPFEVPSVISGKDQVPVKLSHGKFVKSFERMIFSYGAPIYGTIDPTPFVAIFFTLLFGIMFGDLGQGLVFVLAGILMAKNVIKVGGWNKFAPIFIAIGCTSSIMGLLTGEFFSNETLLEPFSEWITGLFGNPHAPILKMMPSSDPSSIRVMFSVFGIAVAIGFIINSIGLIINIINNLIRKNFAEAFFGKNGLAGALFFWYVIFTVVKLVAFKNPITPLDWVIIGVSLFFAAFAEPFERLVSGERPILENGFGTFLISGIVELIEVISGYLSNTVSFVRVGAFALSHAVLDFLILTLTEMCGGEASIAGIAILIIGNGIVIVLEGMIVAIQVIRLQYYEFFSKFFHETGDEFKPFKFEYK